jgi:hypothetical protein
MDKTKPKRPYNAITGGIDPKAKNKHLVSNVT